jgi:hypothetical protein
VLHRGRGRRWWWNRLKSICTRRGLVLSRPGSGIESPTAGLDGDALFVLYPVGVAVPVAVAAAVVAE